MQLYDGRLVEAVGIPSQTGFHLTVATPSITLITVLDVVQLFDGRLVEAVGIPSRTGDRLTACVSSQARRPTLEHFGLPAHGCCKARAAPCAARSAAAPTLTKYPVHQRS